LLGLLQRRFLVVFGLIAIFCTVHVANYLLDGALVQYGIYPRDTSRIMLIASAPFIHGSWEHLLNNVWAFIIFSAFCLLRSIRFYVVASLFIILFSGLCVWMLARSSFHVGASGWIYGLWSLCIALAWFDRNLKSIAIGLLVMVLYGGMAASVFSFEKQISFEGHISGAIGGILFAFLYNRYLAVSTKSPG